MISLRSYSIDRRSHRNLSWREGAAGGSADTLMSRAPVRSSRSGLADEPVQQETRQESDRKGDSRQWEGDYETGYTRPSQSRLKHRDPS